MHMSVSAGENAAHTRPARQHSQCPHTIDVSSGEAGPARLASNLTAESKPVRHPLTCLRPGPEMAHPPRAAQGAVDQAASDDTGQAARIGALSVLPHTITSSRAACITTSYHYLLVSRATLAVLLLLWLPAADKHRSLPRLTQPRSQQTCSPKRRGTGSQRARRPSRNRGITRRASVR
jgi:hypothetical protein